MAINRVIVKPSADKALQYMPVYVQHRIVAVLKELAITPRPHGVVKMKGGDNLWRVRLGVYRIVYEIHDAQVVILVLRIGHRREVYD